MESIISNDNTLIPNIYDLDKYKYICIFDIITMTGGKMKGIYLSNYSDDYSQVSINLDKFAEKEQELIIAKIVKYLTDHPKKRIYFDGCCFHR